MTRPARLPSTAAQVDDACNQAAHLIPTPKLVRAITGGVVAIPAGAQPEGEQAP